MKDVISSLGYLFLASSMFYGLVQLQEYNMFVNSLNSIGSCYQRDLSEESFVEKIENLGLIIGEKVYCDEVIEADISIKRIGDLAMDLEKIAYFSE